MEDISDLVVPDKQAVQRACTALVPYVRPSMMTTSWATAFLCSGVALRIRPEVRISAGKLTLIEKVQVHEVVVDSEGTLQALVVHESQLALAVFRFGHCLGPLDNYDRRDQGLVVVPVCRSGDHAASEAQGAVFPREAQAMYRM